MAPTPADPTPPRRRRGTAQRWTYFSVVQVCLFLADWCRRAYGFRSYEVTSTALYHAMGDLPTPELRHSYA